MAEGSSYSAEEEEFLGGQRAHIERFLREHDIAYRVEVHERVFTVEVADRVTGHLAGLHVKNLFLKSKKGELFLVVVPAGAAVDLKRLAAQLGASGGLRFAPPALLCEALGVLPGSVNPFCVLFDPEQRVRLALGAALLERPEELLWAHAGSNDNTAGVSVSGLLAFFRALKRDWIVLP
jgi:Ala-tRNA(Pro) deacylase